MIVDRYYYAQLNKQEQAVYKAFYNGLMAHEDVIPIPIKGQLSKEVFNKIFRAMTRDNPLIYYVNQSACNWATDAFGHTAICPQYFYSSFDTALQNRVSALWSAEHLFSNRSWSVPENAPNPVLLPRSMAFPSQ